jgi:hypothetical protein
VNVEVLIALLVTPLLLAGFGGTGGAILGLAGYPRRKGEAVALLPVALALGFATFSYLGYLLAFLAPVHPALVVGLALAGVAAGRDYYRRLYYEAPLYLPRLRAGLRSPLRVVLAAASGIFVLLFTLKAMLPLENGDALEGYMFTARWLAHNGLTFIPYNPQYSLFPINTEMVFALSFPFGTDLIAKTLDVGLGIFFFAGVYEFARRHTGAIYSFLATASFALVPQLDYVWATGKIDMLASLTLFMGFSLLVRDIEHRSLPRIVAAAFLIGTACSQKYTTWFLALALPVAVALLLWRAPRRYLARALVVSSLTILLCLVPHFAKNVAWAGNPVAPFANNIFQSDKVQLSHGTIAVSGNQPAVDPLRFGYDWFFWRFEERWRGELPLLLLVGIPLFLLARRKPTALTITLVVVGVQMAVWYAILGPSWLVWRFLLAPVALLAVVSAFGVQAFAERFRVTRWAVVGATVAMVLLIGLWQHKGAARPVTIALGQESRSEYLERVYPTRGAAGLALVAPHLDADDRLMINAYQYLVPEDKLPYTSTEREYWLFENAPEADKLDYLRENGFRYWATKVVPGWARGLPLVAEFPSDVPDDDGFRILRVDRG